MSIELNAGGEIRSTKAAQAETAKAKQAAEPLEVQLKSELNMSIVQTSLSVSLSSQNEPLALLYKSAIAALNDVLKAELGENAIEKAAEQDHSAEATAQRIVSLSTGFYEAYKAQHPGEDEGEVFKNFMATIKSGFERGFKEAQDILRGLKVLSGDIAAGIDKTYELVQKGYAEFEAAHAA